MSIELLPIESQRALALSDKGTIDQPAPCFVDQSSMNRVTSPYLVQETQDNEQTSTILSVPAGVIQELPPVDEGRSAWLFCFSAFALELLIWGWNNTYGVFQAYYLSHAPFNNSSAVSISAIGTASLAIQYMEILGVMAVFQRYPTIVKPVMLGAVFVCSLTLLVSSFATQVWQLVMLQGVIFGLAAGTIYAPIIMWLPEWFVHRRGLAGGIIFGGSGIGGFVFPFGIGACLDKVGFPWTMRICALILGVLCNVALLGMKSRIPVRKVGFERPKASWPALRLEFFRNPLLLWMLATNMVQALGFFPVSVFISTYTSALTSSPISPTVALSLFNAASVVCFIIFGRICDSYPYPTVMLFSGLGSALGALFLWGFATNTGLIFAFALVFGGLSGGFASVWPAAATEIAGTRHEDTSLTFATFGAVKGLGAIVGPIIAASLRNEKATGVAKYGALGYRNVELFVGAMAFATAACAAVVAFVSKSKRYSI